jgi:ABC-2 type transport system permease protein
VTAWEDTRELTLDTGQLITQYVPQGCAASLVGQSLLIDTKALEAAPITVPASASMTLGMVFVFVLPAAVLIAGAVEVLLRRRR